MATATSSRKRSSSSRSRAKKRSLSKQWTDFKKTGRYKIIAWFVRNTGRLFVWIGYRPGVNDKIKNGAKRVGSGMGTRVGDYGHSRLDKRDLQAGVMTDSEWDAYERIVSNRPAGVSEAEARQNWLESMLAIRRDRRNGGTAAYQPPAPAAPAFQPPAPRNGGPATQPSSWRSTRCSDPDLFVPPVPVIPAPPQAEKPQVPVIPAPPSPRRPATRKVDRAAQLASAWDEKFDNIKGNVMAADGNLAGALTALRGFVDQQPTDRRQLHEQLAGFAAFFQQLGAVTEAFRATLERPLPDGTPGVPGYITSHLNPVADHGHAIGECAKRTAHAWEDRFADAVKVAADEEKPSDEFLRAPAV